jgi:hypothetical protein
VPGTMSEEDLVLDLKASLQDAASVFTAAASSDFKRHLKLAALAFASKRPRTLVGSVTLVADQAQYSAPADFASYKSHLWGIAPRARCQPWEKSWPGRLPDVRVVETSANPVTWKLQLDPPPTAGQISALGSEFKFYYFGAHAISTTANQTTINAIDRGLLLLRAQAEAMRELAYRGIHKPVQLRDGYSGAPRNSTPTALYEALLNEFGLAA